MLLIPWVIPPAMSTLAWLWLFDPSYSAFNWLLRAHRHRTRCRGSAIPTGRASRVILVNVWIGAPFFMIMYLAALKSVPEQLYEAAAIDGANWWQKLWFITLPMMRNIIAITVLFSLIVTFANFDIVRVLTTRRPARSDARVRHLGVQGRHRERRHPAGRLRVAVHGADPGGRPRSSSCATSTGAATRHDRRHCSSARGRSPRPAADVRQHAARPQVGRCAGPTSSSSCS